MRPLTILVGLLAVGCGGTDRDGDGLTRAEELELGLDPNKADSDGDGIDDGAEVGLGLDPNKADSDGDRLPDGRELELGTDPLDPDTDGDELRDNVELNYGSDPLLPDTEGDGLGDYDEWWHHCDPHAADTDGDSYNDVDELAEGSIPTDPDSRIYMGYWPYNPDKDAIDAPEWGSAFASGQPFPRYQTVDQFGDTFDFYDLAFQGKSIVLDVSAEWCGPCNSLSAWLENEPGYEYYDEAYPGLREAVEAGDVFWVTVIGENINGADAQKETVARWFSNYPHPLIPVLADEFDEMQDHIQLAWWPSLLVVDEEMQVVVTQFDEALMSGLDLD
jgi:hypothetical protein